jgi:hypothetical protein
MGHREPRGIPVSTEQQWPIARFPFGPTTDGGDCGCGGAIFFLINVASPLQNAFLQIDTLGETRQ